MLFMIGSGFIAMMRIGNRRRVETCFTHLVLTRAEQAMRLAKGLRAKPYQ